MQKPLHGIAHEEALVAPQRTPPPTLARRWRALDEVARLEAEDSGVHNAVHMFASNPQVAMRADVSARSALTKYWD